MGTGGLNDVGAEPLVRAAVAAPDATDKTKKYGQMLLDRETKIHGVCRQ